LEKNVFLLVGCYTRKYILEMTEEKTTKVFREMKWAEELGSGKKNIKKYAPLYYDKYEIDIQNNDKFVFSITYRDETNDESQTENNEESSRSQAGLKQASNRPLRNHPENNITSYQKKSKNNTQGTFKNSRNNRRWC